MRQPAFCCFFASSKFALDLKRCTVRVGTRYDAPKHKRMSEHFTLKTSFSTIIARNWSLSTPYDLDIFVIGEGHHATLDPGDAHMDIGEAPPAFLIDSYYTTPRPPCQPWDQIG